LSVRVRVRVRREARGLAFGVRVAWMPGKRSLMVAPPEDDRRAGTWEG
jgi:hypothetical protein